MSFSRQKEEEVIARLIEEHPPIRNYCVDIGASTGAIWSNVWGLLEKGWDGLLVECDPEKTPQLKVEASKFGDRVKVDTEKCTPISVNKILDRHKVPHYPILSLDIDGYDYHVLRSILRIRRPEIIVCEINTCVPPPYKFAVNFDPKYWWGSNTFFGMSLSAVHEFLCIRNGYNLIEVIEDNAIFSIHGETKDPVEEWERVVNSGEQGWGKEQARHIFKMPTEEAIDYIYNILWVPDIGKFDVWI